MSLAHHFGTKERKTTRILLNQKESNSTEEEDGCALFRIASSKPWLCFATKEAAKCRR